MEVELAFMLELTKFQKWNIRKKAGNLGET